MLNENIKTLRKQKGYSQETMAQQLNVVRQTVSKWEKGLSVPDAEMLNAISELFEVPVSTLLGSTITEPDNADNTKLDEIAKQLAIMNEQLANQSARKRKTVKRIILGVVIGMFAAIIIYISMFILFKYERNKNTVLTTTDIECVLNGETYYYSVTYDENYRIHCAGGDAWIANHVIGEDYTDDANVFLAKIEDYFTDRGGTYKITEGQTDQQ
ncbi:MAG: helix-turn-helix transcriptional regulator [Clostridiales bacterium]|nr:helix-turn-helix transcriptional regulator [Clostridiales bacterium]